MNENSGIILKILNEKKIHFTKKFPELKRNGSRHFIEILKMFRKVIENLNNNFWYDCGKTSVIFKKNLEEHLKMLRETEGKF